MRKNNSCVDIWFFDNTNCSLQERNYFWQILSCEEKNRALRFVQEKHQQDFIFAHGLLRKILAQYLNIAPEKVVFTTNEFGKPSIAGAEYPPLEFSFSHSQSKILCAVTTGVALGVDIEAIRQLKDYESIAQRFFSESEKKMLAKLCGQEKLYAFFHCWARKEAYIKALGKGLSYSLAKFSVSVDPKESRWVLCDANVDTNNWSLFTLNLDDDYAAALAVMGEVDIKARTFA